MNPFHYSLVFLFGAGTACASLTASDGGASSNPAATNNAPVALDPFVVTATLDLAREAIVPALGATSYGISSSQLDAQAQGANAPFNQVLLRVPGMAQDSFGQLHLRGEHANLQYKINEVLLPEGIAGFGQELDPRIVDEINVLTGSLPAQYGYRTAGVIDIHTKSGASSPGSDVTLYGGSHATFSPAFTAGGANGRLDYFVTGSALTNELGIENPADSRSALHDRTEQLKGFGYFSYLIDQTSRLNLIISGSAAKFQIPDNPGQTPAFTLDGMTGFDSSKLDENQHEHNSYAIVSYQKSTADAGVQVAVFTRTSGIAFTPDPVGDLIFNGVASRVQRSIFSNGAEVDANWDVTTSHTLRGGLIFAADRAKVDTTDAVFAVGDSGNVATTPEAIVDNQRKNGTLDGFYLQDEWKAGEGFTVNYGLRADVVNAYVKESQVSPRLNIVYEPVAGTRLHAGYARYFTPPPLELISAETIARFTGTTNAPKMTTDSPVRSERSHYFDLGVTQKLNKAWSAGLDGYFKTARNQLDEGQFGQALVFSPFNYRNGRIYGVELSTNYTQGGFSAYGNFAWSRAMGRKIASGEFQFGQNELDYIATHDVFLDHDQRCTASAGVSYRTGRTLVYGDMLFGTGLRSGFANTGVLPSYTTVNIGLDRTLRPGGRREIHFRIDVVNLFDRIYELRDGSGIGVGASQFGARRGVFGGIRAVF